MAKFVISEVTHVLDSIPSGNAYIDICKKKHSGSGILERKVAITLVVASTPNCFASSPPYNVLLRQFHHRPCHPHPHHCCHHIHPANIATARLVINFVLAKFILTFITNVIIRLVVLCWST